MTTSPGVERRSSPLGPEERRDPGLPQHRGQVAGGTAGLADHRRHPPHHHAVLRQGPGGHQHRVLGDIIQGLALEQIDRAGGRPPGGDDAIGQEHLGPLDLGRQVVGLEPGAYPQGPGLEQVKAGPGGPGPTRYPGAAGNAF